MCDGASAIASLSVRSQDSASPPPPVDQVEVHVVVAGDPRGSERLDHDAALMHAPQRGQDRRSNDCAPIDSVRSRSRSPASFCSSTVSRFASIVTSASGVTSKTERTRARSALQVGHLERRRRAAAEEHTNDLRVLPGRGGELGFGQQGRDVPTRDGRARRTR